MKRNNNLQVRLSDGETRTLNDICDHYDMDRAEMIRYLIRMESYRLDEKEV